MELKEPKPKKNCRLIFESSLPIIKTDGGELHKFHGCYNGFSITIKETDDKINEIIRMGYFGKANLSRTFLSTEKHHNNTEIIRQRQHKKRKEWKQKFGNSPKQKKVIIVPDSDSECEDYFDNLTPQFAIDSCKLKETINLMPEEAFYLQTAIGVLNIEHNSKILNSTETWDLFTQSNQFFVQNYITYHHFRSKNWVVKPGIKFGGDFLLYKQGPPFYHASYVVIIDVINSSTLERDEKFCRRPMKFTHLTGLHRLCQTAGKDLLIFQIFCSPDETINYETIKNVTVKEILMRNWISPHEKDM